MTPLSDTKRVVITSKRVLARSTRRRALPTVVAALLVSALASTSAVSLDTRPLEPSIRSVSIGSANAGIGSQLREFAIYSGRLMATSKRYSKLYVDPSGTAVEAAKNARKKGRASVAKNIEVISKTAQARWFGDWNSTSTVR